MQISKIATVAALIGAVTIASIDSASARRNRTGAVVAGAAAGLILGGLIASQGSRGPYYGGYYAPGPAYYDPGPAYYYAPAPTYYAPPPPRYYGDPIAYCMSRFRSYDPYSMTYMGYDGRRHPCP